MWLLLNERIKETERSTRRGWQTREEIIMKNANVKRHKGRGEVSTCHRVGDLVRLEAGC